MLISFCWNLAFENSDFHAAILSKWTLYNITYISAKTCCPAIKVSNEWEPEGKVYYNVGYKNGRQYWATDKKAIWFNGIAGRTYSDWMYGTLDNLGGKHHRTALAVSNEKRKCPTGVKDWHYSSNYSNDDPKIFTKIKCVCKYLCMSNYVIFM